MNHSKKSDLKQIVLTALSTFPCAVTISEILKASNSQGKLKITKPEITTLLKAMASQNEVIQEPVNRYACLHIWQSDNGDKKIYCSRCGRVKEIEEIAIVAEVVNDDEERQEAIELKAEIIKLISDFFVNLGEKLKYYQEKKLYRFESDNFGQWCDKEIGIKRDYAYKMIRAFTVYQSIKETVYTVGIQSAKIPLPSSERQIRPLTKLPEDQWYTTWLEAVEKHGRTDKPPSGKLVQEIVSKRKKMEKSTKYNPRTDRYKVSDVVRVTAKNNSRIKEYHHCWGQIVSIEEHSYTITTWKGTVSEVAHDDLMFLTRASKEAVKTMTGRLERILTRWKDDPDTVNFLHYLGTKPNPGASLGALRMLDCLEVE